MKTTAEIIKERYPFYDLNIAMKDVELNGEQVERLMEEYHSQFQPSGDWDEIWNEYMDSDLTTATVFIDWLKEHYPFKASENPDTKSWIEWIERRVPLNEMQKQYVGFAIAEVKRLASQQKPNENISNEIHSAIAHALSDKDVNISDIQKATENVLNIISQQNTLGKLSYNGIESFARALIKEKHIQKSHEDIFINGIKAGFKASQEQRGGEAAWISVEDGLPEDGVDVLALTTEGGKHFCHIASINNQEEWATHGEILHFVTHWQYLPTLPTSKG